MSRLTWVVRDNERVFEQGRYLSLGRKWVDLKSHLDHALHNTRLYRPDELTGMLKRDPERREGAPTIEVVESTTGNAGRWLARKVEQPVAILNFASARNAGGGYERGTKAQEEDLCRCSALYPTLLKQPDYYKVNRGQRSMLYTDHIIYSDAVPFFRTDGKYDYLEEIEPLSVITAPAPNAGEFLRREAGFESTLEEALRRRAGMVLAVAEDQGIRNLVLGAWGCGVFRNDPEKVADAFGQWLESERFKGCFDNIVFAILAKSLPGQVNLEVFKQRFG